MVSAVPQVLERQPSPDIHIPDDWQDLGWGKMKALATRFSDVPVHNRGDAVKVIEAEIVRRKKTSV